MQSLFLIRRMEKQTNKRNVENINERNMCAHSLEQANASTSGDYNFHTFHFMLRLITLKRQEKKFISQASEQQVNINRYIASHLWVNRIKIESKNKKTNIFIGYSFRLVFMNVPWEK